MRKYFRVSVEYHLPTHGWGFDRVLEDLAQKHGGSRSASGCMIGSGERDIEFAFESKENANLYYSSVKNRPEILTASPPEEW